MPVVPVCPRIVAKLGGLRLVETTCGGFQFEEAVDHTDALGNMVSYWRASDPTSLSFSSEDDPFDPDLQDPLQKLDEILAWVLKAQEVAP